MAAYESFSAERKHNENFPKFAAFVNFVHNFDRTDKTRTISTQTEFTNVVFIDFRNFVIFSRFYCLIFVFCIIWQLNRAIILLLLFMKIINKTDAN